MLFRRDSGFFLPTFHKLHNWKLLQVTWRSVFFHPGSPEKSVAFWNFPTVPPHRFPLPHYFPNRSYWLVSHHVPYHEQIVKHLSSCIRLLPTSQRPSFQILQKLFNPSLKGTLGSWTPGASPGRLSQQHTTSPRCRGFGFVGNTGSQDQWIHFQGGPAGCPCRWGEKVGVLFFRESGH